jgi:transcription antitermination protein NusB
MGKRTKARECALQMLYQWDMTKDPIRRVTESFWKVRTTTDETRAMSERLTFGTHAELVPVDEAITAALKNWRFDRVAAIDKAILRLATFELLRDLQTPSSVVLDEAVELAKRFGEKDSPPFVNGVLDAINRTVRPFEAKQRNGSHRDTEAQSNKKKGPRT